MLELLEGHYSLGLAATALIVLRLLMIPILTYNILWSAKGFWQLLRGITFPTSIYQSVVFLFSSGVMGYHILAFFGQASTGWSVPWSLGLQCVVLLASVLAFVGRKISIVLDFEKFYWIFSSDNLDLAMRVSEMNQMDPHYTKQMVEAAETTLAIRLAQKAVNGKLD